MLSAERHGFRAALFFWGERFHSPARPAPCNVPVSYFSAQSICACNLFAGQPVRQDAGWDEAALDRHLEDHCQWLTACDRCGQVRLLPSTPTPGLGGGTSHPTALDHSFGALDGGSHPPATRDPALGLGCGWAVSRCGPRVQVVEIPLLEAHWDTNCAQAPSPPPPPTCEERGRELDWRSIF